MSSARDQKGFGLIEVLIIIAIVAILGVGGWYVWAGSQQKSNVPQSDVTSSKTPSKWKTFCDDANKICFRYPPTWTIEQQADSTITTATLLSPKNKVQVSYNSYDTRDGSVMPFYTTFVGELEKTNGALKIIGGYVAPNGATTFTPQYDVVDDSVLAKYPLGPNATSDFLNTARFSIHGKNLGHLRAVSTTELDAAQARAWFADEEAIQALKIIRSFYIK